MELQEFVSTLQDAYRMVKLENGAMMRDLKMLKEENKMLKEQLNANQKDGAAKPAAREGKAASKKKAGK